MSGVSLSMTLTGIDELIAAMHELGETGSRAAMQDALKKAAQPVAEAARILAPRGDGIGPRNKFKPRLADSIKVLASLSRSQARKRGGRRHDAEIFVGPTVPHAHLIEFGHLLVKTTRAKNETRRNFIRRRRRKDGSIELVNVTGKLKRQIVSKRVIGHVPAHPFMRPAIDSTRERAVQILFTELGGSVVKVARRYRRQAERGKLSRGARRAFRIELGL